MSRSFLVEVSSAPSPTPNNPRVSISYQLGVICGAALGALIGAIFLLRRRNRP